MDRVAVFIDAGYLFAQGSALLAGSQQPRRMLKLDEQAAVDEFGRLATTKTGVGLLRVYWYDGASFKGPSAEQQALAHTDHVKLRLGFLNSVGQQKGVDSLIVTDLIELARNRAISDAVLLSGDEDVRVGVQVAQSLGVRVHLVGIQPSRGSQSKQLRQEADTCAELDLPSVSRFLQVVPMASVATASSATSVAPPATPALSPAVAPATPTPDATLQNVASDLVSSLAASDISTLKVVFSSGSQVPPEFDGKLLARSRAALSRNLTGPEGRRIRGIFITLVKAKAGTP